MIYLVIDPGEKYEPKGEYHSLNPKDIPNSISKSTRLQSLFFSGSARDVKKQVVVWNADKLSNKKCTLLARFLVKKSREVNVIITTVSEKNMNKHLMNIPMRIRRLKGRRKQPSERSIFEKISSYMFSREIPTEDTLFIAFRTFGDSDINSNNRKLLKELDLMLFKTHSKYIAVAWAGCHQPQRIRLQMKSYKIEEKKPKPLKIDPIVKKTRKAKMQVEGKSRDRKDRLAKYF